MNGELYQLSCLVLYVKDMIRGGRVVDFKPGRYVKFLFFSFIPKRTSFFLRSKSVPMHEAGISIW